jgi:DNA-directed RNA polymerase subunit RPC12/RpoP
MRSAGYRINQEDDMFFGNSTAGLDGGQDIPDDGPDGWECEECGHVFSVASASSIEEGDEIIPGVTCPECGAFVFTD